MTDATRAGISAYMSTHPREGRPKHEYTLEEFGFTRAELEQRFRRYREKHILPIHQVVRCSVMLLKDKVVIVSGIGPGLGVKLAIEAAREGARAVAIGARTAEKLDDAEKRMREANPACKVLKLVTDIRDAAQCKRLAESGQQAVRPHRRPGEQRLLLGHAGHRRTTPISMPGRTILETNVIGTMNMTQAVVPVMKAQGGGAIVNISSMATVKPHTGEAGYAASKGAINVAEQVSGGWNSAPATSA